MPKILIADKVSDEGVQVFKDAGPDFEVVCDFEITPEDLVKRIPEFDALVVRSRSAATRAVIEAGTNLKVIGRAGVGLDNVDIPAATERGVIVMNTPGGNTVSTAEHACALMIALSKNLAETTASMKAGKWEKKRFKGSELQGKTLGVIGLGRIGTIVAQRMQGFGMRVLGYDPYKTDEAVRDLDITPATVDEICERADFITLHTPKTPETANILSAERIAKMKRGARIVNCARGGLIDEKALVEALKSGHLAGAALDVFADEPIEGNHPILELSNVVLSPHLGAATVEAQEAVAVDVAKQIVDTLKGGPVINAVNYPSLDPELIPRLRPYMDLAHQLGSAVNQLCKGTKTKELAIKIEGEVTKYPVRPITLEAIRGFLKRTSDVPINFVNAIPLAEARGIKPSTISEPESEDFPTLITVKAVSTEGDTVEMAGTLYSHGEPRIVSYNGQRIDMSPAGNVLVIENRDVPGVVGAVGTLLAQHRVNIAQMNLGVDSEGRRALMIVMIDKAAEEKVLNELNGLENILSVRQLAL